jgi:hypothetical protein
VLGEAKGKRETDVMSVGIAMSGGNLAVVQGPSHITTGAGN